MSAARRRALAQQGADWQKIAFEEGVRYQRVGQWSKAHLKFSELLEKTAHLLSPAELVDIYTRYAHSLTPVSISCMTDESPPYGRDAEVLRVCGVRRRGICCEKDGEVEQVSLLVSPAILQPFDAEICWWAGARRLYGGRADWRAKAQAAVVARPAARRARSLVGGGW